MDALSDVLRVTRLDVRAGSAGGWIRGTFHHAADQIAKGCLGSEVLLSRLSEPLFVETIRRHGAGRSTRARPGRSPGRPPFPD